MKVVALLSGGIDSTVLLAHLIQKDYVVAGLSFDYNQTHCKELFAASQVADHYNINHRVMRLELSGSALTGLGEIPDGHAEAPDATYVPGRNIAMLAIAIGEAERIGAGCVAFGANHDDFNGYPDCRPDFVGHMNMAGLASAGVSVTAPFTKMTKRQVVEYGHQLCAPLELTWSCYRGGNEPCGTCGACTSRIEAVA